MNKEHPFQWLVIGSGPAGIAETGKLLDQEIPKKSLGWIDPSFPVADLGAKWHSLPTNTTLTAQRNNLKNRLLTASKPRGSIDRKRIHIFNIEPFVIVEPRELLRSSQTDSSSCFAINTIFLFWVQYAIK